MPPSPFAARRARIAAAMRDAGGGVAHRADRARAAAQQRQRPSVPARQRLPLPDRLRRARRLAARRQRRPHDARLPAEGRRARDSGTASASAPTRRRRRSASTPRSRSTELDETMVERLADQPAVWWRFDHAGPRRALDGWLERVRAREPRWASRRRRAQRDLAPLLAEMRVARTPASSRRCAAPRAISAAAHVRAMRFCAARFRADPARGDPPSTRSRPSCCTSSAARGAEGPAYGSIVAAGANACILHYAPGATPAEAPASSA